MPNAKLSFHYLSYLQYPFMLIALFYCYRPVIFQNMEMIWEDINIGLVFMGLGISFSTLQDTTKTQNKLSRKIFENAKYSKIFLFVLGFQILFFITLGMFGVFNTNILILSNLAFGFISIGIGMVGMLKSAIEMAENHRKN
jgi:magnesium-transporting ATPase (P-type)